MAPTPTKRSLSSDGDLAKGIELLTPLREADAMAFAGEIAHGEDPIAVFAQEARAYSEREMRYIMGHYSYELFSRLYLAKHFYVAASELFHAPLYEMLHAVETHRTSRTTLIVAPPETGKSTCGNLLLPLRALVYPSFILRSDGTQSDTSKSYIVFLSATQGNASKSLATLSAELQTNAALIADFGSLYLDQNGRAPVDRPWTQTRIVTSTDKQVEVYGRYGRIRSAKFRQFRPDLIVADDIEDDKSVQSSRKREEDFHWVTDVLLNRLAERNGNLLMLGTLLHTHSALVQLIDHGRRVGWNVRVFPLYQDTPDGRVYLWEQRYGKDWIERKALDITQAGLEREYLHNPQSETTDLNQESFTYYDAARNDVFKAVERGRFVVCMGVDPACKTAERNDYTAIVPVARDPSNGIMYVLPAIIDKLGSDAKTDAIIAHAQRWSASETGIESVQAQVVIADAVQRRCRKAGIVLKITEIPQRVEKALRISALFSLIKTGALQFLRGDQSHATIIEQLVYLYTTDHDDGADALEIGVRIHAEQAKRKQQRSGVRADVLRVSPPK